MMKKCYNNNVILTRSVCPLIFLAFCIYFLLVGKIFLKGFSCNEEEKNRTLHINGSGLACLDMCFCRHGL